MAEWTFLHQRVYDPISKSLTHLTDPSSDLLAIRQDWDFLGPLIEPSVAEGIAEGRLCPIDRTPFVPSPLSPPSKTGREKELVAKSPSIALKATAGPNQKTLPFAKVDPALVAGKVEAHAQQAWARRLSIPRSFKDLPIRQESDCETLSASPVTIESSPYFASPPLCDSQKSTPDSATPESIDPIALVKENIPLNGHSRQDMHVVEASHHGIVTRSKSQLLADYRYSGQAFKKFKN